MKNGDAMRRRPFISCESRQAPPHLTKTGLVQIVSLLKPVDASAGINQLLLACEERVALRANINMKVFFGRTRFNDLAAGALDRSGLILRMDFLLHDFHLFH